ncbi:FAD-dependent oxidoreductase [Halomicronema sp. CCY15110]|uniref:FAD-dependent oxidoreductase n=1 Tax=Halomicronema sp. CCY15110 TaxID=2767773 RepID=UPI001EF23F5A|nr:FAD-dependent oxidoreductase [Halomicronema sp. CCY15110]
MLTTDVLVVGGGAGGTAAAIQAARRGANTILVSELPWLGGMLTAAGVSAPDGNELLAWQTGLWGAFLRALRQRQPGGLDHAWVSFFTYEPRVGAAIFADWVNALPNLQWLVGKRAQAVLREGDRIVGVRFDDCTIRAQITLDGTELGDLLALGEVPHRWGWEAQSQFNEPSAPGSLTDPAEPLHPILQTYPVQSPTWVVLLQDAGAGEELPKITPAHDYDPSLFRGAWEGCGAEQFMNYGRLPNHQFMLNWPTQGNDYGHDLHRLIGGDAAWQAWAQEAIAHSRNFAHHIQSAIGRRYGLATGAFPQLPDHLGGGALALMPYYRESRRLVGLTTVTESDILPQSGELAAALPVNDRGEMSAIAIGNYPNDHHYPGFDMPLAPKARHWGGRWTGTPFAIPYEALIPAAIDGLLTCEKNISVSHIANGATRLQPVVLGLGQAAGMAAALCIEQGCEPRDLPVAQVQMALLEEPTAPAAIVPLIDTVPEHPEWRSRQLTFKANPEAFSCYQHPHLLSPQPSINIPADINAEYPYHGTLIPTLTGEKWSARFQFTDGRELTVVTLNPSVDDAFQQFSGPCQVALRGTPNWYAGWILVNAIAPI